MNQKLHFKLYSNSYQNIQKLMHKCLSLKPLQITVNLKNKMNKNLKK
jgi:hypothetical protein